MRTMKLVVNGEPHEHSGDGTLSSLLREIGANPEHTAVAANDDVISRSERDSLTFKEGDRIEIMTLVAGG